jgi:hypothetical protein
MRLRYNFKDGTDSEITLGKQEIEHLDNTNFFESTAIGKEKNGTITMTNAEARYEEIRSIEIILD